MWQHLDTIAQTTIAIGVIVAGFWTVLKTISRKFEKQDEKREIKLSELEKNILSAFSKHEFLDQRRHEDNLVRFGDIRVILAKLGYKGNGELNKTKVSE